MLELDPNQGGNQPDEIPRAPHKPSEFLRVRWQAKLFRAGESLLVRKRKQLRPGKLRFAEEDIYGDIANPFELIEQTALARGIALCGCAKLSQVTLIQVAQHLSGLAQHR